MNIKIKVLIAILAITIIVIGAGAVIHTVWSVKEGQVEQKAVNTQTAEKIAVAEKATAALRKDSESAFNIVTSDLRELEKRTAAVEKQSTSTAEATGKLDKAIEKTLGEIDVRVNKVETYVSNDWKAAVEVGNKITAAGAGIEELGKRMEALRTAQAATQTATSTTSAPAATSSIATPLPATSVPAVVNKTVQTGMPTRMASETEALAAGIESKSYRMNDIKDGKVELEDPQGGPIVNTTITVKHSFRGQKDKVLIFVPSQIIAPYSDAYSVTFTADKPISVKKRR
ncbi:MAG: hypothetical protein AAB450_00490 [Patescibacteria group bacterium]